MIRSLGVRDAVGPQGRAINSILTEAILAADEGRSVSYSRNSNYYTDQQRYRGTAYTYARVPPAVEKLANLGLIDEDRISPGDRGWQSSFTATPRLVEAWTGAPHVFDPHEIIHLKNEENERLVDYTETRATRRMRRELQAINEYLNAVSISLHGSDITRTASHLIVDGAYYRPDTGGLRRIFNRRSFSMGGRAYGWWQSLPKHRRSEIILDGEVVSEPDFHQFHASLLYAKRGQRLEEDTAYDVDGFTRKQAKLAFNVALNAASQQGAIAALCNKSDWGLSGSDTGRLLDALARRHPLIADDLNNDCGIGLMRLDSEITISALKACMKEGIMALPVHDSMITAQRYAGRVAELMEANASRHFGVTNPCKVRISGSNVSQMPSASPIPPSPTASPQRVLAEISSFRGQKWQSAVAVLRKSGFELRRLASKVWSR